MNGIDKLLQGLEERYFGDLIMAIVELVTITIGLAMTKKDKYSILFLGYLFFDFSILLCDWYLEAAPMVSKRQYGLFIAVTNSLIALVELLVYYYFFSSLINSPAVKKIMSILKYIFLVIVAAFIMTRFGFFTKRYYYIGDFIGAIEFVFLMPPCLVYFYQILQKSSGIPLFQRPSFWITSGIFFYSTVSIPYYLINKWSTQHGNDFRFSMQLAFFYIPFTINFIFLARAFLCKKTLTI